MQEKASRKIQTDEPANTFGVGDQSTQPSSIVRNAGKDLPVEFGRYRLLKQLGEGGMGTVFLAHDTELDRRVALKLPHFTGKRSKDLSERFRREARLAATLDHTNICRVFDIGEHQGRLYLTMALVEGKSLHEIIKAKGAIELRTAVTLLKRIANAVQFAHDRGIIHRDLKPANIMIKKDRDFVIMDFGLARRLEQEEEQLTAAGAVLGTPAYMAPELLRGENEAVGPQSDVYSLGIILFELLTGQRPFQGTLPQVYAQVLTAASTTPSSIRSTIDASLDAIYQRVTHADVSKRFKSADEFATALGNYLAQPTQIPDPLVQATQVEDVFRTKPQVQVRSSLPPRRRNPTMLIAGGAAFFAILLGVIVILIRNKDGTTTELRVPDGAVAVEVKKNDRTIATLDVVGPYAGKVTTPAEGTEDLDQGVAKRVLALGGNVSLISNGEIVKAESIAQLPMGVFKLKTISLFNSRVNDQDLKMIGNLSDLEDLDLWNTSVTDVGIRSLHGLTKAIYFNIGRTQITDTGLNALLASIPSQLRRLVVSETLVGDQGITKLSVHPIDWHLNLAKTTVGDEGLLNLKGKQIWRCELDGTRITDVGILNLGNAGFDYLGLSSTGISDAGIEHCKKFTKLGAINLKNTKVTDAGVASLQKSFPDCKIEWNGKKEIGSVATSTTGQTVATAISQSAIATTSHVSPWENLEAIKDGFAPVNSADKSNGAYGNWDGESKFGNANWVQFEWSASRRISSTSVYWWNDGSGIAEPNKAFVEYWDGSAWSQPKSIGTELNRFNDLDLNITTNKLRVTMSGSKATGILEWKVLGN